MANIKSAKKRILVTRTKTDRNKSIRSSVKTAIKKVFAAIESGDKAAATEELKQATKVIEMAATKGVPQEQCSQKSISHQQSCKRNGLIL